MINNDSGKVQTKTKLVANLKLDEKALAKELEFLDSLPKIKEQYDEFSSGTWINHSLWNSTGHWKDTEFIDIDGHCIETET